MPTIESFRQGDRGAIEHLYRRVFGADMAESVVGFLGRLTLR